MKFHVAIKFILSLTLLLLSGLCFAKEEIPQFTTDGLELVKDSKLALVYVQPGASLSQYSKVYLVDTYVAFKKNWQRNQNRSYAHKIKASDMERMRSELATMFHKVFSETLAEGNYELVTERGEDVLIVKPAIINLDATAPDTMSAGSTRSFSGSAGEMTLYIELYDSVTDAIIAKALDRKRDRNTGQFQWQNRVTNRAAANRILKVWATALKNALDEAHGK